MAFTPEDINTLIRLGAIAAPLAKAATTYLDRIATHLGDADGKAIVKRAKARAIKKARLARVSIEGRRALETTSDGALELSGQEAYRLSRTRNLLTLLSGAAEKLTARGASPRPVAMNVLQPILEQGSLVDDETLADMFQELLANASDARFPGDVHPSYPKILSELSGRDAEVLLWAWRRTDWPGNYYLGLKVRVTDFAFVIETSPDGKKKQIGRPGWTRPQLRHSISAIERHQLWRRADPAVDTANLRRAMSERYATASRPVLKNDDVYEFTQFGIDFLTACTRKLQPGARPRAKA